MGVAEERTENYIRNHLSHFLRVDVLELLSHLPCLTPADQDKIRAHIERFGNHDSVWKLFDHLRRRSAWVTCFITALQKCEHMDLADEISREYASNQTRFQNHPRSIAAPVPPSNSARRQQEPQDPRPVPYAGAPGTHPSASGSPSVRATAALPDTTYNGYPEELEGDEAKDSPSAPVQESQLPERQREVPGAALNPAHSGDTSRNPQSSLGYPYFSAPAPTVPGKHHKASGGSGDSPPAATSLPTSPRGPISPSVSFVSRSAKKESPTSGAPSLPSHGASSSPSHRATAAAPPPQASGEPSTRIPGPPKVRPAGSPHPAPPPQVSPGPAPSGQAPPPHVEEVEISKPGVLQSHDGEPYSGGSDRLIISNPSGSVGSLHISSENLPEENDYLSIHTVPCRGPLGQPGGSESPSLGTFEVRVHERPSEDLLGSSPASAQTPSPAAQPGRVPAGDGSWGVWLGSTVAVVLFSVALAVIYKRGQK
ncbi:mitochondrial antiviral-signaling protein isoform X2 [Dromiciops gliroides]|uniref:mitochondrial antiviral-signaling protein isoform X2 n=1 Tax=Dromiciops gliroides TaxID=33562 RepID=UPI001CC7EC36|nr:mitochondrial antiviral-signaling protein isoform X2 [Dromiciops gliroides]